MKLLVIALLVTVATANTVQNRQTLCTAGVEWTYSYVGEAFPDIPGTGDGSGVGVEMTFGVTKLDESNIWQLNIKTCAISSYLLTVAEKSNSSLCSALTKYSLPFQQEDGHIYGIFPHRMEQEDILNVKRGILSAFQVSIVGRDNIWEVEEVDVLGHCWTDVREVHTVQDVIVLKNRDTTKCRGWRSSTGSFFTPSVDQEAKFAYGRVSAEYRLTQEGSIISASLTQYEELAPLSKEAGRVVNTIIQKFVLLTRLPLNCEETVDISLRTNTSLQFDHEAQSLKLVPTDAYTQAEDTIEELSVAVPHDIPWLFMELINYMRHLTKLELNTLKMKFFSHQTKEYYGNKLEKYVFYETIAKRHAFFVDALMFVGTEPAVEMIVDMADNSSSLSRIQKLEFTFSLAATPLRYINPCKLLDYSLRLASRNYYNRTTTLVLGTVLDRVLSDSEIDCRVEADRAIDFLLWKMRQSIDQLPEDFNLHDPLMKEHVETFKLAIHAIKAIKNARVPKAIPSLKDAVLTKKLLVDGRVEALYALKETSVRAPVLVREFAVDIYIQQTEVEELRIAAFNTFMHTIDSRHTFPPELMLRLRRSMLTEQNENVRSYVCSYVTSLTRTEDPSLRKRRDAVVFLWRTLGHSAFLICKSADLSFSKSKSIRGYVSLADLPTTRPLPRDVMGAGVIFTSVFNNASNIPHASAMKVKANMFGFDFHLLETGFRAAGMEELIRHLFGPTGYLHRGTRDIDISGLPRNDDFIYDVPRENMSASGYLKLFGQELLWEQFGQEEIMELLYNQSTINELRDLVTDAILEQFTYHSVYDKMVKFMDYLKNGEYSLWRDRFNYTKTVSFLDFNKVIPTIMGMPLIIKAKATGHVQLHATSYVTYRNEHPFLDVIPRFMKQFLGLESQSQVNIYGEISPKVSFGIGVEVLLDAYDYRPRLVFFANATSNFTQRAFARVHPNFTVNFEVYEMPQEEVMLLNASYTQYAEVNGERSTLGINKRNNTQIFKPIFGQFLGIEVFSNISYPNTSTVSMAPLFPLSGPANFTLLLKRVDERLTYLNFTAWNQTEMSIDNGEYRAILNGVGLDKWINSSLIWNTIEHKKIFNFSAWSHPLNVTGLFNFSSDDFHHISGFEGNLSVNTTWSNFTGHATVNRTFLNATASRRRYFDDGVDALITVPDYWATIQGSLKQQRYGNLLARAYVEGWRHEHFIFTSGAVDGVNVNFSVQSSLFRLPEVRFLNVDNINGSYKSPFPIFNPVCHVFNDHFVTFDGLKYSYPLSPNCEYILARHRHLNDTFGITILGDAVRVYINGTVYELRPDSTQLRVDDVWKALPYHVRHVVNVRKVWNDNEQYIHLRAFAGIEIFYNNGDVVISVDRFYSNQTAGLCGNSNSNGTWTDELRLPSLLSGKSLEAFTESWISGNTECRSHNKTVIFPDVNLEAVRQCSKLFNEILVNGKEVVPLGPFFNACVHEVSLNHNPEPIVKAYVLAVKTQSVSLKACEWTPWSAWSSCRGRKQSRTRQVAKSHLGNICLNEEDTEDCESRVEVKLDAGCSVLNRRLRMRFEEDYCKTDRKYPSCNDACEAVYSEVSEQVPMRCYEGKNPSEEQLVNGATVTVPYNRVVECRQTLQ